MPNLTVTLGVAYLPTPIELHADIDTELDPEQVFAACNRIVSWQADVADLACDWQVELRTQLEAKRAPSMGVGDIVSVVMNGGRTKAVWVCSANGWDTGIIECDKPIRQPDGRTWMGV